MTLMVPSAGAGALQVVEPRLDLVRPYEAALLAAAEGKAVAAIPSREALVGAVFQAERECSERTSPLDAAALAGYAALVMQVPGKDAEPLLKEVTKAIEGYPPDIAAAAVQAMIRTCRRLLVPSFVELAEAAIAPRRAMLQGARILLAERKRLDAEREAAELRQADRRAELARATAALRARWPMLPSWFAVDRAFSAERRVPGVRPPRLVAVLEGDVDAAGAVFLRRAAAFDLAIIGGAGGQVAGLLAAGKDTEAAAIVDVVASRPPAGTTLADVERRRAIDNMRRALAQEACASAAQAEGMIAAAGTTTGNGAEGAEAAP